MHAGSQKGQDATAAGMLRERIEPVYDSYVGGQMVPKLMNAYV